MARGGGVKHFGIGHIKKHTVGTSNEVSFSVLDARSGLADAAKQTTSKHPFGLFTVPGKKSVNTTPSKDQGLPLQSGEFVSAKPAVSSYQPGDLQIESSDDYLPGRGKHSSSGHAVNDTEVQARKRARMFSRLWKIAVAVVILAVAGYFSITHLQDITDMRQGQARTLQTALEDVIKADATLVAMDEVLASPIDTSLFEKMNDVQANLDGASHQLAEASAIIDRVIANLDDSVEKDAAEAAARAVAARTTMLETGSELMGLSHDAALAISLTDDAWDRILGADGFAREAAEVLKKNTREAMQESADKTAAAYSLLGEAKDNLERCQSMYPDLGFGSLLNYTEKRYESMQHANASNQAMLANDPDAAAAENEAYNKAEAEAAALATNLPMDLDEKIRAHYEQDSEQLALAYQEARSAAASADSFLRNYLGTSGK